MRLLLIALYKYPYLLTYLLTYLCPFITVRVTARDLMVHNKLVNMNITTKDNNATINSIVL